MTTTCKSKEEQEAEKIAAQIAAAEKAKAEKDAAYKAAQAEDDTTDIHMVPIEVDGEVGLEVLGMFFNEKQITSEDEPAEALKIEKDVLDRSSGFIIGRFAFEIPARAKIVYEVFVDGVKVDNYGTNLPYQEASGIYDTVLFKYPNSAKANKIGVHKVHVRAGVIIGIVEKQLGLVEWGKTQGYTEADFTIELLPMKM